MDNAQIIIDEMNRLKKEINELEQQLKTIQVNCEHDFESYTYSRKCMKCSFVDVLYY